MHLDCIMEVGGAHLGQYRMHGGWGCVRDLGRRRVRFTPIQFLLMFDAKSSMFSFFPLNGNYH